jgi:hypothetical protein
VRNSMSKLAKGVDIRGDGGFAVLWWATGTGECEDESPPAPWPEWMFECASWGRPAPQPMLPTHCATGRPDNAIDGLLDVIRSAPEGTRNAMLFWSACRFAERVAAGQMDRTEAQDHLLTAAICTGLTSTESTRTISSAFQRRI